MIYTERTKTMRRKALGPKRKLILLIFLPMFFILSTTIGYAYWQDYVQTQLTLKTTQKPSITVSTRTNAPQQTVKLLVNQATYIIQDTKPNPVQIKITIENNGIAPIDKIQIIDIIPPEWQWNENISLWLIRTDGTSTQIDPTHYTVTYIPEARILTTTIPDIKTAIGKPLQTNETIRIMLDIEYDQIGSILPQEYAYSPSITHNNSVTATAWVGDWSSKPTKASVTFRTVISWVKKS